MYRVRPGAVVKSIVYFMVDEAEDDGGMRKDSIASFDLDTEDWTPALLLGPQGGRLPNWEKVNRIELGELRACLVSLRRSYCIAARIRHAGCMHGGCEPALHPRVWRCCTDALHAGWQRPASGRRLDLRTNRQNWKRISAGDGIPEWGLSNNRIR